MWCHNHVSAVDCRQRLHFDGFLKINNTLEGITCSMAVATYNSGPTSGIGLLELDPFGHDKIELKNKYEVYTNEENNYSIKAGLPEPNLV